VDRVGAAWCGADSLMMSEYSMKVSRAFRALLLVGVVATIGCNQNRPVSPAAPSLFIPDLEGVWSGPMTLLSSSGGECTGEVVTEFLPPLDRGTISVTQTNANTAATFTMESTGLACYYTGTASLTTVALNATSCDRHLLLVACKDGQARELQLVGSSLTGSWTGNQFSGQTAATYNVFTPPQGLQQGRASLIVTHSFTATRR
jgi:hypothetical protein